MDAMSAELRAFFKEIGTKGGKVCSDRKKEAAKRRAADRRRKLKAQTVAFSGRAPVVVVPKE